ncbi:MAG: VOC family protein [Christensenellaceae bacterium]|nr:VOC family protein [Christensenellaceae bacterium]
MARYNFIPETIDSEHLFTDIAQVGIVVADLEKVMAAMELLFGAPRPQIVHAKPFHGFYRGEPAEYTADIAYYEQFNGVELEFIQPLTGQSIWADHLKDNQTALHHVRFNVRDYDACRAFLEDKGIAVYQCGDVSRDPAWKWCYFDTMEQLSFILEILGKS